MTLPDTDVDISAATTPAMTIETAGRSVISPASGHVTDRRPTVTTRSTIPAVAEPPPPARYARIARVSEKSWPRSWIMSGT